MGLDTTHGAWNGPYSSFNRWRTWLAAKIGVNLKDCIGYGEGATIPLESIDHDIQPLLDHSDCDGELTPGQCKKIAKGLKDILDKLPATNDFGENLYTEATIKFRNGCLKAAKANEVLEFH